jgi:GDPmannose 4,6-dehydratase
MASKRAIIFGESGQDGSFMAELLADKGYEVYGINRENVKHFPDIINKTKPDEIYNFAGVSDVLHPYKNLNEIFEINAKLPQQILEIIVRTNKHIKFFQASSALIFGRDKSGRQNEQTPFQPMYPYGVAKLYAHNMVNEVRETYGIFACCGIFFNHESERRKDHFFSKKICKAAATKSKVTVGSLDAVRDFGYAKDYIEAAYLMMQSDTPKDYVIGTGILTSLEDFARMAFEYAGLDYKDYVIQDKSLVRKKDTEILRANRTAIFDDLGWIPKVKVNELIKLMIDAERVV